MIRAAACLAVALAAVGCQSGEEPVRGAQRGVEPEPKREPQPQRPPPAPRRTIDRKSAYTGFRKKKKP